MSVESLGLQEQTEQFQRDMLAEALAKCLSSQRALFHERVYPNGVPADKLTVAYDLVARTLRQNEKLGRKEP